MLTTVDCMRFWNDMTTIQKLKERGESAGPEDKRSVGTNKDIYYFGFPFSNISLYCNSYYNHDVNYYYFSDLIFFD